MDRAEAKLAALRISATTLGKILEEVSERVADLRVRVKSDAPSPADVRALANAETQLDYARERLSIALARLEHAKRAGETGGIEQPRSSPMFDASAKKRPDRHS